MAAKPDGLRLTINELVTLDQVAYGLSHTHMMEWLSIPSTTIASRRAVISKKVGAVNIVDTVIRLILRQQYSPLASMMREAETRRRENAEASLHRTPFSEDQIAYLVRLLKGFPNNLRNPWRENSTSSMVKSIRARAGLTEDPVVEDYGMIMSVLAELDLLTEDMLPAPTGKAVIETADGNVTLTGPVGMEIRTIINGICSTAVLE